MGIIPKAIVREIDSLDKRISDFDDKIFVSNAERIEFLRQLRSKNESILKSLATCYWEHPSAGQSPKAKCVRDIAPNYMKSCGSHPRCVKFRKEYLREKEKRELEELEELGKCEQFKSKPAPSHIYLGLYSKMVDRDKCKRLKSKEKLTPVESARSTAENI